MSFHSLTESIMGLAFWVNSKTEEVIEVNPNIDLHASVVAKNPEKFGIPSSFLDNLEAGELESGEADEELMNRSIRNGWIRVHVWGAGKEITFDVASTSRKIMYAIYDFCLNLKKKGNIFGETKVTVLPVVSGMTKTFAYAELADGSILESKLNEEMAAWWFDPRTEKFKTHISNDHEVMVEKDPHWFGLDYTDLSGYPPKTLALQKGFVRVDVFHNYTHIELKEKPNGKMKDALTLVARKLYGLGMSDDHKIVVATDRGNGREYDGTLGELYSTEIFESVLNEGVMKALWLDPKRLIFKSDHPEHRIMVEKDPGWFGLGGDEYKYSPEDARNQALEKGFVRIDMFSDHTCIEIHKKPNGKMKDVLSWFAEKLLYDYSKSHKYKIWVYINSGGYETYETDVDGLLTTSVFESKFSKIVNKVIRGV